MNGVLGMNELLMDSGLTPQQRIWAVGVQRSGRHLLAVLNDVLDVSKIESGHLALETVAFDLREVLDDAVAMFLQPALAKGLALSSHFTPPQRAPQLRGDPLRLRQVLVNLIGNAVKFTTRGSVVVRVDLVDNGAGWAQVHLGVEDTGIGIAPEAHDRVFDAFSQADNSTTRRFGGTGLGLAICKRIVTGMGGNIRLESAPGHGSHFCVDLRLPTVRPTDPPESPAAPPAKPAPAQLNGHVLLVEDNPVNQSVAATMLKRLGLQYHLADHGAMAVDAVRAQRFDLVLMDCQMPVMDGYVATAEIRQLPDGRGARLPIVALTANAAPGEAEKCLAAGMDAYLAKPITLSALQALLSRWLPPQEPPTPGDGTGGHGMG
jgi:CheY-like chemotaxis protein